jgi:F-type H+-transporting ATPase subunit delta
MATSAAARRYARALFALARDEGRIAEVRQDLAALSGMLDEHAELRNVLFRPLHPAAQRKAALAALGERVGAGPTLRSFLQFLIDQRRLIDFPAICDEYEALADDAAGRTRAEVVAAHALADGQLERIRRALVQRLGQEVDVSVRVDESLLGGVVAKVGDLVFDGSLRTQLRQLRANLAKEG